jgi:hypothetical protein
MLNLPQRVGVGQSRTLSAELSGIGKEANSQFSAKAESGDRATS